MSIRKKHKLEWIRVTNEFVATLAEPEHVHCGGKGFVGDDTTGYTVCSCAALNFRRQFIETGRVRQRSQRIGNRDVTWQEYRPLGNV